MSDTPKTARQMLDVIDEFLAGNTDATADEREKLWNVLSALRGPDEMLEQFRNKQCTTAIIRRKAFPNAKVTTMVDIRDDATINAEYRMKMMGASGHFERHVRSAFTALGLKWGEVNP